VFVLGGCEGEEDDGGGDGSGECERKVYPGLSRSGNGICDREYEPSRECLEDDPPECDGIGQWFFWNWAQCSRGQDCGQTFTGVDVRVTCCALPEGDGGGVCNNDGTCDASFGENNEGCPNDCPFVDIFLGQGPTTTEACGTKDTFDPTLGAADANWRCCQGTIIQDGEVTCCDGKLLTETDISSGRANNPTINQEVSYLRRANSDGEYFGSCIFDPENSFLECGLGGEKGEAIGDNTYKFTKPSEFQEKLLFCEAQCNVLVGDAVDSEGCEPVILTYLPPPGITSCPDDPEFKNTQGGIPGVCELGNLRWLNNQAEPFTDPTGAETREGVVIPGEEVILSADLDTDCTEQSTIEFNLFKHFPREDESHNEDVSRTIRPGRGDVLARWSPPWIDFEDFFDKVENPKFKFAATTRYTVEGEEEQRVTTCKSPVLTIKRPPFTCGDGHVDPDEDEEKNEECDDGNLENGDGCNSVCKNEFCGDNLKNNNDEVCDGDVQDCTIEGYTGTQSCLADCTGYETACTTTLNCGDGIQQDPPENCDDGEALNGQPNRCNAACTGITGSVCVNGVPEEGEECDDGNDVETDTCSNTCQITSCGDSVVQNPNGGGVAEVCDDGINDGSYGSCNDDCTEFAGYCGDGKTQSENGEFCDGESFCDENCHYENACRIFNPVWRDADQQVLAEGAHIKGNAEGRYVEGDKVFLSVEGDPKCEGDFVTFTLYLDDATGGQVYGGDIPPVEFFVGRSIIVALHEYFPKWFVDENDPFGENPRYFFLPRWFPVFKEEINSSQIMELRVIYSVDRISPVCNFKDPKCSSPTYAVFITFNRHNNSITFGMTISISSHVCTITKFCTALISPNSIKYITRFRIFSTFTRFSSTTPTLFYATNSITSISII